MQQAHKIIVKFKVCVEPDEGEFHAYCPAFEGLHVGGETEEQAIENAKIAAEVYIQSLIRHGDPLPVGDDFVIHHNPAESSRHEGDNSAIPNGPIAREVTASLPCVA